MVEKGEKNGKSSLKPVEKKSENKNYDFKIRDFGVFYEKLAFFRFPHFFPQEFSCGKKFFFVVFSQKNFAVKDPERFLTDTNTNTSKCRVGRSC